ncbi:MAG: RagB/SusD family nutrient uptake outer membrane protein [Flavobacteriaceae bacterium]|nr:RagB/SusD family nutrient uptake outer membrane protein [Flavobacteriaceae bacterium]
MKKTNPSLYILPYIFLFLFSCNEALEEVPDNRTQIDTPEKIGELLTAAYPQASYATFLEPRTDNAQDKGPSSSDIRYNTEAFYWRDTNDNTIDFSNNYWNQAYKAIAQANHALQAIEKLDQGEQTDALKAEALVARAYSHFMLVNIWAKSYNPNTAASDLGIPYVTEPEDVVFKDYKRHTVAEVYAAIEKDLTEGIPMLTGAYETPKYHFNIDAAHAFASRFYLLKGEWEKVVFHSTKVLGTGSIGLLRDWANKYRGLTYSQLVQIYSAAEEPTNLLLISANSLFGRTYATSRYQLNPKLNRALFNRSTNPTTKNWAYPIYGNDEVLNIPKQFEYFKVTNPSAGIGYPFVTYVLFSADEVLLNRIEANIMLGNITAAVADINLYLSAKTLQYNPSTDSLDEEEIASFYTTDSGKYHPWYSIPSSHLPFIDCVLQLKQKEFFNEGMRWFDIRRMGMTITHQDVFGSTFTLTKDDLRKQLQIPETAAAFGLQKNPR